MVNVMQIFADFIPSLLMDWTDVDPNDFVCSRYFAVCVGVVLILPWIGVKDISKLEILSTVCLSLGIVEVLIMVANSIGCLAADEVKCSVLSPVSPSK